METVIEFSKLVFSYDVSFFLRDNGLYLTRLASD